MAAAPFKVKALFEYVSNHEDDLPFHPGQVITVTDVDDPAWYGGEYEDDFGETREGIFPRNFVEKYEPVAPPRPVRTKKKEPEPAALPPPSAPEPEPEPELQHEEVQDEPPIASPPPAAAEPRSPEAVAAPLPKAAEPVPGVATAPAPPKVESITKAPAKAPAPGRSLPPPVTEKPSSSSFKDRIAAFNKSAAPPIAPFKPSGLGGGSGFVKKPFVAPPPSRNSFVPPPPREVPVAKIYRRDEDPEIKEKEAQNNENAAKAGLIPGQSEDIQDEDQPKPMSLKERMALLQKQQQEAAQRHADVPTKKEKPKRPFPKGRPDSEEPTGRTSIDDSEAPAVERRNTESTDDAQPAPVPRQPLPVRRKSVRGSPVDGNEADLSGAGDTTEGPDDLTEREDSDAQPKRLSRAPTGASTKHVQEEAAEEKEGYEDEGGEQGEEDEDEEDEEEEDPEVRRKEELRARMAKMSAGMGGMGGMINPFAAPLPPKKKKPPPIERRPSEQPDEDVTSPRTAPPIPTAMALPGMIRDRPREEAKEPEEASPVEEDDISGPTTSPHGTAPDRRFSSMEYENKVSLIIVDSLTGSTTVPPIPGGRPAPPPVPADCMLFRITAEYFSY